MVDELHEHANRDVVEALEDQEPPRPSVQDAVDAAIDEQQKADEGRAAIDAEQDRANEDAAQFAIGLMHSDEDES